MVGQLMLRFRLSLFVLFCASVAVMTIIIPGLARRTGQHRVSEGHSRRQAPGLGERDLALAALAAKVIGP